MGKHSYSIVRWTALATLALASSGCSLLPAGMSPRVENVSLRVTGLDLRGVDLAFDFDVRNPYPFALKTPRFRYGFAVEGLEIFSNEVDAGLDLAASQLGRATLPVRVNFTQLWDVARELRGANQANYTISGAFLLSAAGQTVKAPFSHSGVLPIFQPPTFSVVSVEPAQLSLTRAKIAVHAEIENPNIFGLDLRGLGYALRIGEIELGNLTVSTQQEIGPGQAGRINLEGEVSAFSAIRDLLAGGAIGAVRISAIGNVQTPYGVVNLEGVAD